MGEGEVPSSRDRFLEEVMIYEQGLMAGQDIELQQQKRVRTLDSAKAGKWEVHA